jgi:hypothetical protein
MYDYDENRGWLKTTGLKQITTEQIKWLLLHGWHDLNFTEKGAAVIIKQLIDSKDIEKHEFILKPSMIRKIAYRNKRQKEKKNQITLF